MSTSLLALVLAALPAQSQLPSARLHPITAPVRDAGILHVATNTWTRKASGASLGSDTIYDNTCSSGYYSVLSGDTYVDEGRLPSPSSPSNAESRPGCAASYTVNGVQFAYCTDQPGPIAFEVNLYESYVACASVIGVLPTGGGVFAGLPGSPGSNLFCWIATIDLSASPQGSVQPFSMPADGDGSYTEPEESNRFGWSIRAVMPWPNQYATGPLIAGVPNLCQRFDGTRWDGIVDYSEDGTGMGTADSWRIEGGPTAPNCYWFGSTPFASFHLELYADACPGQPFQTAFCDGDQPNSPCPCGNGSTANQYTGCRSSLGVGGRLRGTGTPSVAGDTLVLSADQLPASATMLFFQGTQRQPAGTVLGDGLRCAGGVVTRLGVKQAASGAASFPGAGDPPIHAQGMVTGADTRTYQVWYRNSAAFCTPATFNLTNGWEVRWIP